MVIFLLIFNFVAQAHQSTLASSRFEGLKLVLRNVYGESGVRGFYVGLTPGLLGPTVAWGVYMLV